MKALFELLWAAIERRDLEMARYYGALINVTATAKGIRG